MKKLHLYSLVFLMSMSQLLLLACGNREESTIDRANLNAVKSLVLSFPGSTMELTADLSSYLFQQEILIQAPDEYTDLQGVEVDLSEVNLHLQLEDGFRSSTPALSTVDLRAPYTFQVNHLSGATKDIQITVQKPRPNADQFKIEKGINVASFLHAPYPGVDQGQFFSSQDVQTLKTMGFDHIRLALGEEVLWDENGGKIRSNGFDLLHRTIRDCLSAGIKVIVDLHETRNHSFTQAENALFSENPVELQKFISLWEDLSDELSTYSNDMVAYELLNEPVTVYPERWNHVLKKAMEAIRVKEAKRTIIVDVCLRVDGHAYYDVLQIPPDDFTLMTFHFYAPYLLTYFGFESTTNNQRDIDIQYPGILVPSSSDRTRLPAVWRETASENWTKQRLRTMLMDGINRAKQLNVPVFVGEFGAVNLLPHQARKNWFADIVAILAEEKVGYTSWDYKGYAYSIMDAQGQVSNNNREIVDILVGKTN